MRELPILRPSSYSKFCTKMSLAMQMPASLILDIGAPHHGGLLQGDVACLVVSCRAGRDIVRGGWASRYAWRLESEFGFRSWFAETGICVRQIELMWRFLCKDGRMAPLHVP